MSATDVYLRSSSEEDPDNVRLYYQGEIVGELLIVYVEDAINLSGELPHLVSPVFITDAISFLDYAFRMFNDIEVLGYSWAWLDTYVEPSSTPISGSSPYSQAIWNQILSKLYDWYWIIELTPILDVIIKNTVAQNCSIMLIDQDRDQLFLAAANDPVNGVYVLD